MEIAGTTQAAQTSSGSALGTDKAVDKDAFMKLLITQMRYQDPLDPMDNQQFLSQLAQFSSLEQMQSLNQKFESSMALTQSLNNSAAAGLIGKTVRASGDTVSVGASGPVDLGYFLPAEASTVTLTVSDGTGKVVRTLVGVEKGAGAHQLAWDGRDENGARVPEGSYSFAVNATDTDGADLQATSMVDGLVEGVTFKNGTAYLLVDGREVSLSNVLEIHMN